MAFFLKNLRISTLMANFRRNAVALGKAASALGAAAEICWFRANGFDGLTPCLFLLDDCGILLWNALWRCAYYLHKIYILADAIDRFVGYLFQYAIEARSERIHTKRKDWAYDVPPDDGRLHARREQRRLRRHAKRYAVARISNVHDAYELLRLGGLRGFSIGNGWLVRFCTGFVLFPTGVLGFYIDVCPGSTNGLLSQYLWPGRPPDTLIMHVPKAALATVLVFLAFAITTATVLLRIRKHAKKGVVSAKARQCLDNILSPDGILFLGFLGTTLNALAAGKWFPTAAVVSVAATSCLCKAVVGRCPFHEAWRLAGASLGILRRILGIFRTILAWMVVQARPAQVPRPRRGRIRRRSSRGKRFRRTALCTVFNVDKRTPATYLVDFDETAVATVICDNSANIHICNDRNMFDSMQEADASKVVATIGGKVNVPSGVGTVIWSWRDDLGELHTHRVVGVHYFPSSPVNILSVTALARQLNDEETTGIDTKWKRSRLYWKGGSERTIRHPESELPEMPLVFTATNNAFCSYIKRCETRVDDRVHFCHSACFSATEETTIATPTEDWIEVTPFEVGERLLYLNEGHTSVGTVKEIQRDGDVVRYTLLLASNRFVTTTSDHLRAPSQPDIAQIPVSEEDFQRDAEKLSPEQLAELARPTSLSPEQQELMSYHLRFGHLPFFILHRLAQIGIIPRRLRKLKDTPPRCPSCAFGMAHRRPWRSKRTKDGKSSSIRKETDDKPGATVSIDQMVSAQPGLVPQVSGKLTAARIWAATIFLDHLSRHVYVHLMRDQTQAATLEAKAAYERKANTVGVEVKGYRADNGRFAEQDFRDEVQRCMQEITFCGVGAHHQNGLVERVIKDLTLITRTLLLHAKRHWPEMITTMLWPMALKAAEERLNHLSLDADGTSPLSRWSGTDCQIFAKDFHTWGCPVFVLDGRLQSNPKGVPKWEPRARVGIYMGHSPAHAGSVALVLNPTTGHVSPQFHVVFDDTFSTVPYMREGTVPPNWSELVRNSSELATDESFDLSKTWFEGAEDPSEVTPTDVPLVSQDVPSESEGGPSVNEGARANEGDFSANEGGHAPPQNALSSNDPFGVSLNGGPASEPSHFQASEGGNELSMPKMRNLEASGLRRSKRLVAKRSALAALVVGAAAFLSGISASVLPPVEGKEGLSVQQRIAHRYHTVNANVDGTINGVLGSVFSAVADNDCYTYSSMMKQPDRDKFIGAMLVETAVHEKRRHWDVIRKADMPPGAKTILSIWSFKRKRSPDGLISKYKARLCAHGGMQSWGVDYWETYAPVVNWMSLRFILAIAKIHDLDTKVIDFVLAFPQAKLDVDVYMEIPAGMVLADVPEKGQRKTYCLKLRQSLYGLKQGSHNWFKMLSAGLEARGFKSSEVDPCVYIGSRAIIISYVDDCIVISREKGYIDSFVESLRTGPENFEFTEEGSLESYLGVKFVDFDRGKQFEMTQPFLIDRIISAIGFEPRMTDARPTPAVKPLLHRDIDGEGRRTTWNYRSLIGMLNYLQQSTRPDISFAVHQCARFCSDPKRSHERAVKRIVKYLLGSKERGVVCRPDPTKGLECYADADFAGGWDRGDSENPANVMSRTGYVITYAGCPVVWCSKLQTEIALSTMEAEYIALSQAMREVIPLMQLMDELKPLVPFYNPSPEIRCKLFEDNRSCIVVAESARLTPRTKHIAIKYHHFRSFVKSGAVKIYPVSTREQIADIFTKPLDEGQFKYLRSKFLRW